MFMPSRHQVASALKFRAHSCALNFHWKPECNEIKIDCNQMLDDKEVLLTWSNCNLCCKDFVAND